jgi:hypothetical protein
MNACLVCGLRPRTPDQRFCRSCGHALPGAQARTTAGPTSSGPPWAAVLAPLTAAAVCVTVVALLAASTLGALGGSAGGSGGAVYPPYDYPTVEPSPTETASPDPPTPASSVDELLTHIPGEIAESCREDSGFDELAAGLQAAVSCQDLGPDYTDTLNYLLYDSDSSMEAAFDYVVTGYNNGLPEADGCENGPAHGRWRNGDGVEAGSFACYNSSDSGFRLWWTADGTSILARAADADMPVTELWPWFIRTSTGPN